MKFLYCGGFRRTWDTEVYVADALESLGHEVKRIQEDEWSADRMVLKCEEYVRRNGPGHVFLSSKCQLAGMPFRNQILDPRPVAEFLRRVNGAGMRTCLWVYDLVREEFNPNRYRWAARLNEVCDRFVTTDSGLGFGDCVRQFYPGPLDGQVPDSYPEKRRKYECDVAFLGECYGPRKAWLRELQREFGPRFRWVRDGVHGDDLFDFCASAKVVVGPPWPYYPEYHSNRVYLTAGYGGLYAAPTTDAMRAEGWVAPVNFFHLSRDAGTACRQLRDLLASPDVADRVRRAGQRFCQENFTARHRAAELVKLLEQL